MHQDTHTVHLANSSSSLLLSLSPSSSVSSPVWATVKPTTATSAFDQATMLNDQFASTFSARDTPLEVPARSGGESCASLEVIRCSEDKVYHALCAIRPQVAPGPDGIMGWMLRGASLSI